MADTTSKSSPSAVGVVAVLALSALAPSHARSESAESILRKAEDVRNPDLDYAVDFTIHGVSRGPTAAERDASYSMIAGGKDRTVILMRSPESLYGAVVLMTADRNWMLLPKASKPWELAPAQMMNGDVATGDLARMNLARGYTVSLAGEEAIDGEACWRLELVAQNPQEPYARVVYWVAKKKFLPRKIEYDGRTAKLLKSVLYGDYRNGPLGLRPMRLTIESFDEWKESSSLSFVNLRELAPDRATLTPEGMIPFRDAAIAARARTGASDVSSERILQSMASPPGVAPGR